MEYGTYQDYFLDPLISDRQLIGAGYGQEAEQALHNAHAIVKNRSAAELHSMAAFMEGSIQARTLELADDRSWRRLLVEAVQPTSAQHAAAQLRAIAGDVNLWMQLSAPLTSSRLPENASFGEMLAALALWKGQCQARLISRITALMRQAPAAAPADACPEGVRMQWATLTVELTQLWGIVVDLGVELSRAATLAQTTTNQAERLRQAGRAGADKRASAYLPVRERAVSIYRSGSYRSRSKAADDVLSLLRAEGIEISRSSIYGYFSEVDREIEKSRKRNSDS